MANTKGVDNILSNKELTYIEKFWQLNKLAKIQNPENKVRTQSEMIHCAKHALENNEIDKTNKFYEFIEKYSKAEIATNNYGKKLYVKLG